MQNEALAWQVFQGSLARREGLLSRRQLAGTHWQHLAHDLYADSRLERDHALRCHALLLTLPAYAAFAGPTAAFLLGVLHAAGFEDPIHLLVPAGRRLNAKQPMIVHRMRVDEAERQVHQGFPITTPLRTCWDTALWLDLIPAVAVIDGLLSKGLASAAQLQAYATARLGLHGARRAHTAFMHADAGAQSPQESRLRVRLVLAGLPRPQTQYPVPAGSRVLHPDLAWPQFRVAAEYDGDWHGATDRFDLDRARVSALSGAGWIVVPVTARRMRHDFDGVVRDVRAALVSRGWRP